ncbi:hypothetical protein ASE11_00305 [Hydrogenophaga sp. Root209]|uniref:hypothetical protein n=1 Tax=unclassified Hydrogenophaga TaxID=2610897 RepID=UPI0006FEE011|nr:hypothetical protein [Hydrogenophaga sp. Root209]KRC11966.1 hypothetical protein ASE11_00305 [Hydrogenophaga sp. Root209]
MSLSALERSLRAKHPRCIRVNLRLWYALKSANLIEQREISPDAPALAGVLLPHFKEVLVVLDPDLEDRAFRVEDAAEPSGRSAPGPVHAAPREAKAQAPDSAKPELASDRRWMGRY